MAPFGNIRVGVSTVFLKNELTPRLRHAVIFSGIAILLSLLLAAGLSHLALGPLEQHKPKPGQRHRRRGGCRQAERNTAMTNMGWSR